MNLPQLQDKSTVYNLATLIISSLWIFIILLCGLMTAFFYKIKNFNH